MSAFGVKADMGQRACDVCFMTQSTTVKPETTYDNFARGFGERFVLGYEALSVVRFSDESAVQRARRRVLRPRRIDVIDRGEHDDKNEADAEAPGDQLFIDSQQRPEESGWKFLG